MNDKEVRVDKKTSHLVTDGIDSTNQNRKLYKIHTKDLLKPGESVSYKLYLWVDYDTTTEQAINKVFKANVRVDASQAIEKKESLLRKVDVSEGEKVTDLHDDIYNEKFAQTNVSIKNIKLEGNFKNIPKGLYTGNENITEVLLPSTVTSIDSRAFSHCTGLENIILPSNVVSLGEYAFYDCTSLKQISIPGSVKEIGKYAFSDCQNLTSVTLQEGLAKIGQYAFSNNPLLENVHFPSTLKEIGEWTFQHDTSITPIVLPEGLEAVGNSAFWHCENVVEIYIPRSLKIPSRGYIDFYSNQKVKVTLDPTSSYWRDSFLIMDGNGSVGELNLIGSGPMVNFRTTQNIFKITEDTKVKIADTITTIGDHLFSDSKISSITLSNNITSIGNYAFENTSNLTEIQIPSSVTKIGRQAFASTALQNISIGKNLSEIGENAFDENFSLTKITVDNANPNYLSEDGILYTKDKSKLLCYPASKEAESYTIPSTVTSIEYGALNNLLKLDTLVATNYSKQIILGANSKIRKLVVDATNSDGGKTFAKNLKEIELAGEGTMALSVSTYWANSLKSIEKITIHEGITSIRNLDGLTALKEISIPCTITRIEEYSFSGDTSLPEITIPNTVTYVGGKAFSGWTESQTINVDNTEEYAKSKFAQHYGWNTDCKAVINYLRT